MEQSRHEGPDSYLDYDPEPRERELIAAFAPFRRKPTAEEIDDACREAEELAGRFGHKRGHVT